MKRELKPGMKHEMKNELNHKMKSEMKTRIIDTLFNFSNGRENIQDSSSMNMYDDLKKELGYEKNTKSSFKLNYFRSSGCISITYDHDKGRTSSRV